jgi:hypothetical protein
MNDTPSSLQMARTALAASSRIADPVVAGYYAGAARVALDRARDELRELDLLLTAKEAELVRGGPAQAELPALTEASP